MSETASTSEAARKRFAELEDHRTRAMAARLLIEAGYGLGGEDFGLSEATTAAADAMIMRVSVEQDVVAKELSRYEQYVGRRFTAGCQILHGCEIDGSLAASGLRDHASTMIRVLTVLNGAYGTVLALHQRMVLLDRILGYAHIRQDLERLNSYVYGLEDVLRKLVAQVRDTVSDTPYPFAHASDAMTLSSYLRGPDVTTEDIAAVLRDARAHADLFFELYWRVVGELAVVAEQVEGIPSMAH